MLQSDTSFPQVALVRQKLVSAPLDDIGARTLAALEKAVSRHCLCRGQSVAVALGSRGIDGISQVARHCVQFFRSRGLAPFVVPAMGSHGGATEHGQERVLRDLGMDRETLGVPVRTGMEVDSVGRTEDGLEVLFSRQALCADHIVVINRVKPHTKFRGPIESGLCKMLVIGLGKAQGAAHYHRAAVRRGFSFIEEAARLLLSKCPVLAGIALLEDGCGRLSQLEGIDPTDWIEREKALLPKAAEMMGKIPFRNLDVLVIDRIGKDISGIGMDSNVTGRHRDVVGDFQEPGAPKRIFVRDLSPGSLGNGNGIGLADFTTKRLVAALDLEKTYVNALAAVSPEKAAIPLHLETDRQCLRACLETAGCESYAQARIVRIQNTARLGTLEVSRPLFGEIISSARLEQVTEWGPLPFDAHDNLVALEELVPQASFGDGM